MIVPMAGDAEAEDRVRMAVERLRGTRLAQQWPPGALSAGTRVSVVHDTAWAGPWQQVFTGTVSGMGAPEPVIHDHARPGELAYWVDFDEPQLDSDGDGPYRTALIWDRYLRAQ